MGRIADALKKAQQERSARISMGGIVAAVESETVGAAIGNSLRGLVEGLTEPINTLPPRATPRSGQSRHAPQLSPMPHWDVDPTVVAVRDRTSPVTEQYRAVRTWLMSRNTIGERSCLAITSSVANEGKTVTAANLAVILAEVRHLNVLVVDADLRRPRLHELFRTPEMPGLAGVLAGRAALGDVIAQTPIPNLSFLPAGNCEDLSPADLFNSKCTSLVFDEIRERYHYVIVDTPPVQRVSDIGVIGALCSGIIVVVRMHKTPSAVVRQSVRWLQANNLNVIGAIAAACNIRADRQPYDDKSE